MKHPNITLSEKRLKIKFDIFENFCLPGLLNQEDKDNLTVIIKITDNLPEKWKDKLFELTNEYSFIHIQEFDSKKIKDGETLENKYLYPYLKNDTNIIATTRLDDDDVLASNFTKLIKIYADEKYHNKIISFPKGFYYHTIKKKFIKKHIKLIALGLTLIQINNKFDTFKSGAYTGNHTEWESRAKCIFLPNENMYIRTRHNVNDSFEDDSIFNNGSNDLDKLKQYFPCIKI